MSTFTILISSLVLTAVLPISVAALYAMIAPHIQLASASAMDTAAIERFNSETERAAFHSDLQTARESRAAAVSARYRHMMEGVLGQMDPRLAAPYRKAMASVPAPPPAVVPATPNHSARGTVAASQAVIPTGPTEPEEPGLFRPCRALWCGWQGAERGNGSTN